MGHVPGAFGRRVARHRRFVDHGAAADRIGDAAVQRRARRVEGGEAHAVRMVRQPLALEEAQVRRLVEGDVVNAAEAEAAGFTNPGDLAVGRVRVDPVGPLARQAEQDRAVGGVALAGQGERSVEVDADLRDALQQPVGTQPLDKAAGGRHRSHRVRAGWTDPDLEEVEDAANQIFSPVAATWADGARMARLSEPFVLLDDARPGGRATLFAGPREIVETRDHEEVRACLERLRGQGAAGFLAYEAGLALEDKLAPLRVPPPTRRRPCCGSACSSEARRSTSRACFPMATAPGPAPPGRSSRAPNMRRLCRR